MCGGEEAAHQEIEEVEVRRDRLDRPKEAVLEAGQRALLRVLDRPQAPAHVTIPVVPGQREIGGRFVPVVLVEEALDVRHGAGDGCVGRAHLDVVLVEHLRVGRARLPPCAGVPEGAALLVLAKPDPVVARLVRWAGLDREELDQPLRALATQCAAHVVFAEVVLVICGTGAPQTSVGNPGAVGKGGGGGRFSPQASLSNLDAAFRCSGGSS